MGTSVSVVSIAHLLSIKFSLSNSSPDALEALTGEELNRENLIESKWAMETTLTDVTKYNDRLDLAEINDMNREDFRYVKKELSRLRIQMRKTISKVDGKIKQSPAEGAEGEDIVSDGRTIARAPVISLPTFDGSDISKYLGFKD